MTDIENSFYRTLRLTLTLTLTLTHTHTHTHTDTHNNTHTHAHVHPQPHAHTRTLTLTRTSYRYASLLRACAGRPLSESDRGSLDRHGMRHAAIGKRPQPWLQKFAADNLRFVEFERKALPCALMRPSNGQRSQYRSALICCSGLYSGKLSRQINAAPS